MKVKCENCGQTMENVVWNKDKTYIEYVCETCNIKISIDKKEH